MYEIPYGSGLNTIFVSTLWFGGKDANNQIKIAAERYRQSGSDFFPGPLIVSGTEMGTISDSVSQSWNRMWPMEQSLIEEFIEKNNNQNYPLYVIPDEILEWPANGDTELGQAQKLAPYIDVNNDNFYNPLDGDYPKISGDYAMFFIFNDKGNIHTETNGASIGIEVHGLAYAFNSNDEAFNNTIFLSYKIINRNCYPLFDTYLGIFTDFDIGNSSDDFIGCDVQRGCFYGYNGDDFNETANGIYGYGENPPAQSTVILGGSTIDADGYDNSTSYDTVNNLPVLNCARGDILNGNINGLNFEDGIIDNERWGMTRFVYFNNEDSLVNTGTLDPSSAAEYYNYMAGYWKDNTPLVYGGNGHWSSGVDTDNLTKYMFPGSPTSDPCGCGQGGIPQIDWSEESEQNTPSDRRGLGVTGPFTFLPEEIVEFDIAYVYGRSDSPEISSVEQMLNNVDVIRNGYQNNSTPWGDSFSTEDVTNASKHNVFAGQVFPNPANSFIKIPNSYGSNLHIEILDMQGKVFITKDIFGNIETVDVSLLSEGVYFVRLSNGSTTKTSKLIILR